jgi:hypothetical protein
MVNNADPATPEAGALARIAVFVHNGDSRDRLPSAVAVLLVMRVIPTRCIAPG